MKASIWGFLIAAVAFGASTVYLSVQLNEERAQSDKLAELTRELNARIAELEKTREHRFAGGGTFGSAALAQGAMPMGPPPPPAAKGETKPEFAETVALSGPPPRSEAFEKMMRSNLRANNKRIYADLGTQLGLNKEDTARLIDMLTDQQVESFGRVREMNPLDPAERKRIVDEERREDQAEIENFLGASKAAELRDYQETIPARQEMEQLARQLEGSDATLSAEQQKRMLAALIEERKRIPMPQFSDSTQAEDYAKAYAEWQNDYNERVNTQARTILNTEQMTAYSDYQQWQKEMQQQMVTRRALRGRNGAGGNVTFSSMTMPVGGQAMISVAAPAPEEKPRKPQ
jgi:outer membrane murein-binding lipoprotein Lpp